MADSELVDVGPVARACDELAGAIGRIVVGKDAVIRSALVTLLAGGHLLIEDVPGTGKTTLARTLARVLGARFKRIQFTPDLLPTDIVGVNIYHATTHEFVFQPGPVFAEIVLADEINRATPRTQSALLEAMQERQVTVDGDTHPLPAPFMVVATQNPIELEGTFVLPEAQLDRFLMRIALGYPSADEQEQMLARFADNHSQDMPIEACCDTPTIQRLQALVCRVEVGAMVRTYIRTLVEATRVHDAVRLGVSPRGALALQRAAQAHAAMHARTFVLPDDIKALAPAVLGHRLLLDTTEQLRGTTAGQVIAAILDSVEVPMEAGAA